MKKILTSISYFFSSKPQAYPNSHVPDLEESLKEKSELLEQRITENTNLKRELKYLYDICLRSDNCYFRIEFDNSSRLLLFTKNYARTKKNIVAYMPREQQEIISVYTYPVDDTLIISELILNFIYCDKMTGKFLLEELICHADLLGLSIIMGEFGETPRISLEEKAEFYRQAGFQVSVDKIEAVGSLIYKLNEKGK